MTDAAASGLALREAAAGSIGFDSLEAMLEGHALLSREAMVRARLVGHESGERIEAVVTRLGLLPEGAIADGASRASGVPIATAADMAAPPPALGQSLSAEFLRDLRAVPVAIDDARLRVAVVDPFDPFVVQAFGLLFPHRIDRIVARASDVDAAIERLCRHDAVEEALDEALDDDDLERLKDIVSDAPAIRAVNRLIAQAVDLRASDIHLEPTEDGLAVRFRIDGLLREMSRLPVALRSSLVARIKVMAALDLAERRLPQDGRLRFAVRGQEIDLRVATVPSIHGETVVMRILDRGNLALDFTALGFDAPLIARVRETIRRPHGIMLVTGPTGSGKTTTLYAALSELNAIEHKLLTVEDPIEYRLPGIVQTQVNPAIGFTFASALRAFLRQDPDVIMVGEIRDIETAQIAVQAALTGHMILSTLHTNTAAGAISRLLDMEVEPFLLSSVLAGVLAQRLVRRLCVQCREPDARRAQGLALPDAIAMPAILYAARGCDACGGSGYSGRIALLEFLAIDARVAQLILQRADARAIMAATGGRTSLLADGLAKAGLGLTTLEEVLRVTSGD